MTSYQKDDLSGVQTVSVLLVYRMITASNQSFLDDQRGRPLDHLGIKKLDVSELNHSVQEGVID